MHKDYHETWARNREMKAAQCWRWWRAICVKLGAAIDKHDATFEAVQNRIYTEIQYVSSGMVFKLMVVAVRDWKIHHHFQRQRSNGGVQTWINITDFFGRPRKQHVQNLRVRYVWSARSRLSILICNVQVRMNNKRDNEWWIKHPKRCGNWASYYRARR